MNRLRQNRTIRKSTYNHPDQHRYAVLPERVSSHTPQLPHCSQRVPWVQELQAEWLQCEYQETLTTFNTVTVILSPQKELIKSYT